MATDGYFNIDKKEFVITNMRPRRPLKNYLWNEAFVSRVYRGARYNISFKRTGNYALIVDGQHIDGNIAPIFEKGSEHTVICEF